MSNFYEHGNRAYSYGTCIKDVLPDGRTIGNVTKYSATTSKHQKAAEVSKCDILVDNIPEGIEELSSPQFAALIRHSLVKGSM